ncbi:MAG: site-specific integrase [Planctomycetes bacterium]|nr:site-specific integrase [Planctomycetota bacterium]
MFEAIRKATLEEAGLKMNPHLFRHAMAKIYLDRNPGDYETIRRLLGHKSIETTIRFYCGAEQESAIRHFQDKVLSLGTSVVRLNRKGAGRVPARR